MKVRRNRTQAIMDAVGKMKKTLLMALLNKSDFG